MSVLRQAAPGADLRDFIHRLPPLRNPDMAAAYEHGLMATKPATPRGPASIGDHLALAIRRFKPRRRPLSPDRLASRQRRRTLALSGALPPAFGAHYTPAQIAALTIIAGEVKRRGFCDLAVDAIAALAGCGRTSVQDAVREAARQGHVAVTPRPRPGQKNLTNIVHIIDKAWLGWIKRGPARPRPTGFKASNPTNTPEIIREKKVQSSASQEALREVNGRKTEPDHPPTERHQPAQTHETDSGGPRQLSEAMLEAMQWISERRSAPPARPSLRLPSSWGR